MEQEVAEIKDPAVAVDDMPTDPASFLEGLAMDEPLWTAGPTRAMVEDYKNQYPHAQIRITFLNEDTAVLWRTLTRAEWKVVMAEVKKIEDPDKQEEFIFSKIALIPDCSAPGSTDNLPAGVIPGVMNEFYMHCGFQIVAPSMKL